MSLLSSDILHQVFKFFVSDNQIVDGKSLRAASLVCKQWRSIVDSRSLWVSSEEYHNKSNDGDSRSHSVHRSLHIKEQIEDSLANERLLQASLIGFTNLKCYGNIFPESTLYFFVRERATGSTLLLSISADEKKNPSLIRDIYANHFELKEEFLLRDDDDDDDDDNNNSKVKNFFPSQRFPLGITVWKGRVIRWYRTGSATEARETIEQISQKRENQLHQDIGSHDREKNFSFVRHLIDHENISLREKNNAMIYAQGRQHMVDWVSAKGFRKNNCR